MLFVTFHGQPTMVAYIFTQPPHHKKASYGPDTVNTQVVVGANLILGSVATGLLDSNHDSRMLLSTSLYRETNQDIIFPKPVGVLSNHRLGLVNLEDDVNRPTP